MSPLTRPGLAVLAVLSLGDLLAPLLTDGRTPPMSVALLLSAVGAVSLLLVALAWRGSGPATVALLVVRLLSALSAVPALVLDEVPLAVQGLSVLVLALTLAGMVLVVAGARHVTVSTGGTP